MKPSGRSLFLGLALTGAVAGGALATSPSGSPSEETRVYRPWALVLERYVDGEGRVDFEGLADNPGELESFVDYVGRVSPAAEPSRFTTRAAKLAYYINSYNALSMYGVVDDGIPKSLGGLKKFAFFVLRKFTVGGERISLYRYENDVIRSLGEERIHFALNCMAVSCPRLPQLPFSAANLEAELDRETRRFFAEPRNVTVDHERKLVLLSGLLDFYTEDFLAKSPTLIDYVNRYRSKNIPQDYEVEFFDYDWTVNRQGSE